MSDKAKKDDNKAVAAKEESKGFTGVVVPAEGLAIGTKATKLYKQGDTFKTYNESLYRNLVKRQKIK